MRVEFLAFNVFLHTKSEQNVIGNWFCAPIIFIKSVKKRFFNKKYTCTICVDCVNFRIVIRYFLFKKQALNGLLKVMIYLNFSRFSAIFSIMYFRNHSNSTKSYFEIFLMFHFSKIGDANSVLISDGDPLISRKWILNHIPWGLDSMLIFIKLFLSI